MIRRAAIVLPLLLVAGCRFVVTAGAGGSIVSESGNHDCAEGRTCTIETPRGEGFRETFTAVPRESYAFAGWLGATDWLCGHKTDPCVVSVSAEQAAYNVTARLTAEFHHQPELVSPGEIGVEWGIWEVSVRSTSLGLHFSADLDDDGDEDVVVAGAVYPRSDYDGTAWEGSILLNNGDFTYTVAAGDRPAGVHPREVLLADFDGDGRNDLFIADHGLDEDPFPGWSNQLLLRTPDGYRDASDGLPPDSTGFSHNAAAADIDGDGDIDILVANNGGEFIPGPYFLINDGRARFTVDEDRLPERMRTDSDYWPWAVELRDLDADGRPDLIAGAKGDRSGESFVHWGSASGHYSDSERTDLATSGFFVNHGAAEVISIATPDLDADGRPDLILGGYDDATISKRGAQLLVNRGRREFEDQTERRLGDTYWSPTEGWHGGHLFFDFNADGAPDIVPEYYSSEGDNVMAWLNDGTGHFVALPTTAYSDTDALYRFAHGTKVRVGNAFKAQEFFGDRTYLRSHAGVVVESARITRPQ
ncbi:MAG: FG-GAP-like repeat-containing protein [Rhodospirillaceae bacterium]|nr:FG-GAP-like repeat-containing protein [Rhodospirillaceae bacterium]